MNKTPLWLVIYVMSRTEKKFSQELQRRKITHYLPTVKTLRQWSDRKKLVEIPAFPGYIFTFIATEDIPLLYLIPGFVKVIQFDGKPYEVPAEKLEDIRRSLEGDHSFQIEPGLAEGQKVRINGGAFKGIEGVLVKGAKQYNVAVNIEFISHAILLEIPAYLVEPILH